MVSNPIVELVVALVAPLIVLLACLPLLDAVDNSYACESLSGYDPSGATAAERYPDGTWAGLCEDVKNHEKQKRLNLVIIVTIAVVLTAAFILVIREYF